MQVERFSIYDAGRRVIDSVEARLHESSPDVELLEYYAAIVGMGFMGRTVREGNAKRIAPIAALDTRLQALRTEVDQAFLTDTAGLRISSGLRHLVPWLLVALACIVAIAVWVAGSRVLDTQLAQIEPIKAKAEATKPFAADITDSHIQREHCDRRRRHAGKRSRMPFTSSGERHVASYRLPVLANVFRNVPAWANDALCWQD